MPSSRASPSQAAPAPARRAGASPAATQRPARVVLDPHRAFVFPNRIREQRRRLGLQKLMALSERLPDIPYIRLSKIERGEVVARAGELRQIAQALGIVPTALLSDVSQSGFDIAIWAQPFQDGRPAPAAEERFAVLLAAALRVVRSADAALTIAALDQDHGLPAVILSRLENAHKPLDRWNDATLAALCRLFGVADEAGLREAVMARYRAGALDGYVGRIADPEMRSARTRDVVARLRAELAGPVERRTVRSTGRVARARSAGDSAAPVAAALATIDAPPPPRMLAVHGAPLPGGVIADTLTDAVVAAPARAGPRAFALRVYRATLGAGLPVGTVVVADPDRAAAAGGLAAIRTAQGYRLVSVTFDRMGATKGYSVTPDLELDLDELDPADIVAIIGAIFP